ncbi:trypsin-like cysteine/serine peptidase domain-containing protein, partial [Gigaspora rosea]
MKGTYISINVLMFIFALSNYLTVHSQKEPKEPLAKLWNIENDEIPKYLSIEKKLTMVDGILKPLLDDDNFGGTYIDVIHNMIFVSTLNFTKAEQIKNRTEIRQYTNLLNFTRAHNSTTRLNSRFQDINNLAKSYMPESCMGYINSKINNIIIASCNETRKETSNIAFIKAINDRKYYPIFTYYSCLEPLNNEIPRLKSRDTVNRILAGDGLLLEDNLFCSVGFWTRDKQNISYIATAGHCYEHGSYYLYPWNSKTPAALIGKMKVHFLEPIDFGLIKIKNNDTQPVPSVRNSDSERYKELIIKDIISVSSNGAHLCSSGLISHVKCGYVITLNGFSSSGNSFRDNIFVANIHNIPGDSGGPIFSYKSLTQVSLNGIVSVSLFDDMNGIIGVTTISSILNAIENLEVVTVP